MNNLGFAIRRIILAATIVAAIFTFARASEEAAPKTINVLDFGAMGDGVFDNSQAFAKASANAKEYDTIFVPAGKYKLSTQLKLPRNVNIVGEGKEKTILDFSDTFVSCVRHYNSDGIEKAVVDFAGASPVFSDNACLLASGEHPRKIEGLASDISPKDAKLTFSKAHGLKAGDIIIISDGADYSYSGFRKYYKAGEFNEIAQVDKNEVLLRNPLRQFYKNSQTLLIYHLEKPTSSRISDLWIIGPGTGSWAVCARIKFGWKASMVNVKATNAEESNLAFDRSYQCEALGVTSEKALPDAFRTSYALVAVNSQGLKVDRCLLTSVRHGFAAGGDDRDADIPCRDIKVTNSILKTTGSGAGVTAANFHGNVENSEFSDCEAQGITISGNKNKALRNKITGESSNGIYFAEMKGFDFTIEGNAYTTKTDPSKGRGFFVDVGGNSFAADSNTTEGGTLIIRDNAMEYAGDRSNISAIKIVNRGATADYIKIIIENNVIKDSLKRKAVGAGIDIFVESGKKWDEISLIENIAPGWRTRIEDCGKIINEHNTFDEAN